MARTVFRAWLVDLEPFRAKAAGATSFRGMPQALFDHFPDSFVSSELGNIPTGWTVEPLDKVAEFLNGLAMQKHRPADGEESLPVIKIAQLRKGTTERADLASANIPEKYKIKDGDFIFSWSGSLLAKFWTGGAGGLNQHLFKVTSDHFPIWFVACWVWHHLEEFQKIAASKATTMGHIQRGHLTEAKVLVPTPEQLEGMSAILAPLFDRQIANGIEARTLAALRDTLLPKLVSGELAGPDLEDLYLTSAKASEVSNG
jgi:type I restriction enzyme S subunit